jgi:DNA-directed RNA polymerase subunit RPC12/RpoP
MPIPFTCAGCKKAFKAPDHLAGKKVSCPSCKHVGLVPPAAPGSSPSMPAAPAAPKAQTESATQKAQVNGSGKHPPAPRQSAPPDPVDTARREAEAIQSMLDDDRRAEEESQAKSIDFECEYCGEPISLELEMAGKRTPCPSCARIVKVPTPTRKETSDWKTKPQYASAMKVKTEETPEGAWQASSSFVSRESLEEADALPAKVAAPVTLAARLRQVAMVAALVAVTGLVAWAVMGRRARVVESGKVEAVLADIPDPAKNKLDKAALEMMAALCLVGQDQTGKAKIKSVEKHIGNAMAALNDLPAGPARFQVAANMAENLAAMMGTSEDEKDEKKPQANFLQRTIGNCLGKIDDAEWRLDAWSRVCRAMLANSQADRMVVLEGQIFRGMPKSTNRNNETIQPELEATAITGLALLEEGNRKNREDLKDLATKVAESLKGKGDPAGFPSLAVGLYGWRGKELPPAWNNAKSDPEISGIVLARAAQGNNDAALRVIASLPTEVPESVRARVSLAEGMVASGKPDVESIRKITEEAAKIARGRPMFAMSILRLARVAERAGVPAELFKSLAASVSGNDPYDAEVRGAILLAGQARSIEEKQPWDGGTIDTKQWSAWSGKARLLLLGRAQGGPVGDGQGTELFARMGRLMPPVAAR